MTTNSNTILDSPLCLPSANHRYRGCEKEVPQSEDVVKKLLNGVIQRPIPIERKVTQKVNSATVTSILPSL